jgi:hypothetical protein
MMYEPFSRPGVPATEAVTREKQIARAVIEGKPCVVLEKNDWAKEDEMKTVARDRDIGSHGATDTPPHAYGRRHGHGNRPG